jgi:hypothetical protein
MRRWEVRLFALDTRAMMAGQQVRHDGVAHTASPTTHMCACCPLWRSPCAHCCRAMWTALHVRLHIHTHAPPPPPQCMLPSLALCNSG